MKIIIEQDYTRERLTSDELKVMDKLPHTLSETEFKHKRFISKREIAIDYAWGFFDHGKWASIKRGIYKAFVHRFLKKSHLPPIKYPVEDSDE